MLQRQGGVSHEGGERGRTHGPVHMRHHDVHEDDVEAALTLQRFDHFEAVGHGDMIVLKLLQDSLHELGVDAAGRAAWSGPR